MVAKAPKSHNEACLKIGYRTLDSILYRYLVLLNLDYLYLHRLKLVLIKIVKLFFIATIYGTGTSLLGFVNLSVF